MTKPQRWIIPLSNQFLEMFNYIKYIYDSIYIAPWCSGLSCRPLEPATPVQIWSGLYFFNLFSGAVAPLGDLTRKWGYRGIIFSSLNGASRHNKIKKKSLDHFELWQVVKSANSPALLLLLLLCFWFIFFPLFRCFLFGFFC